MRINVPPRAQWRTVERIPAPRKPAIPILEIVPGVDLNVWILSESLYSVWTHYIFPPGFPRGRTTACTGDGKECWVDHEKTSTRYQGWLHVARVGVHESRLMRLTPTAVASEPRLYDDALALRGVKLRVGRLDGRSNGPIWARLMPEEVSCNLRVGACDIGEQLFRMWSAPARKIDTAQNFGQLLKELAKKEGAK